MALVRTLLNPLKGIVANHGLYGGLMSLAFALAFLKNIALAAALPVEDFAEFSVLIVTGSWLAYVFGFGVEPYLLREGSLAFGRKDVEQTHATILRAFQAVILFSVLASTAIWVFFAVLPVEVFSWNQKDWSFLRWLPVVGASIALFNVFSTSLRAKQMSFAFAGVLLTKSVTSLALATTLGRSYGTSGAVVGEATGAFCGLVLSAGLVGLGTWRLPLRISQLIENVKPYGTYTLSLMLKNLASHSDKWLLVAIATKEAYAQYSFAMIIFTGGLGVLSIIGPVVTPKWIAAFGEHGDHNRLAKSLFRFLLAFGATSAVGTVAVVLLAGPLISQFLPDYTAATQLCQVIAVATFFQLISLSESYFTATGQKKILFSLSTGTLVVAVIIFAGLSFVQASALDFALTFLFVRLLVALATNGLVWAQMVGVFAPRSEH